jgi:hypothetical protein
MSSMLLLVWEHPQTWHPSSSICKVEILCPYSNSGNHIFSFSAEISEVNHSAYFLLVHARASVMNA